MTKPPYAGPAAHSSRDRDGLVAAQVRAPYVPQVWRSRPEQARPDSIERALTAAPMTPVSRSIEMQEPSAVDTSAGDASARDASARDASDFYTPPFLDSLPPISAFLHSREAEAIESGDGKETQHSVPAEPRRPDDWPFSDAGAAATELSAEFPASPHEQLFADVPDPSPLPMWNDDDLMDIMPPPEATRPAEESPHWTLTAADASVEESVQGSNSEFAARALETLAARVRSGELRVEGYAPELGDAAVLAAALAALLGIRR